MQCDPPRAACFTGVKASLHRQDDTVGVLNMDPVPIAVKLLYVGASWANNFGGKDLT